MKYSFFLASLFVVLGYGFRVSPEFNQIAAGLALFLLGMMALDQGFRPFAGGMFESVLQRMTNRLWKSISLGIVATTVMQSSTLVSLLTISFLSAGLIELFAGIGIIFGANVGTTTGAWLIAGLGLKAGITKYALSLIVFGVILQLHRPKWQQGLGSCLTGLGLLFLGIHFMKTGFSNFSDQINFAQYAVGGLRGVVLYTAIGAVATVITQSSHATLLLIITALSAGQITYENALALAIGANIGTTVTALFGSMGANIDGKRLALAHLLFNVVTGLVAVVLLRPLMSAVDALSGLLGIAADDYTLKLALFHTLFNVLGVALMVSWVSVLVSALLKYVKAPPLDLAQPQYLSDAALDVPAAAVSAVRKELVHLYKNAFRLLARGLSLHRGTIIAGENIAEAVAGTRRVVPLDVDEYYERYIKGLHSAIIEYLSRLQARQLPQQWSEEVSRLRQASRNIVEAVKAMKHLHKNLSRYTLSPNPYIRRQYDQIRLILAEVMSAIAKLESGDPDEETILSLDAVKLALEESDRKLNRALDELIRKNKISAYVATSLMNDSGYAYDIGRNLLEMAQTLFVNRDRPVTDAERQLTLDDQDLEEVLDKERSS